MPMVDLNPVNVKALIDQEVGKRVEEEKKKEALKLDDMAEGLRCMICTEVMYQAVTLMPCLHSFCGSCYSGWMKKSKECPFC